MCGFQSRVSLSQCVCMRNVRCMKKEKQTRAMYLSRALECQSAKGNYFLLGVQITISFFLRYWGGVFPCILINEDAAGVKVMRGWGASRQIHGDRNDSLCLRNKTGKCVLLREQAMAQAEYRTFGTTFVAKIS